MAQFYDISEWSIKTWVQTGGTREKCFVEDPSSGELYFFKESIEKFPSEFWSEIIASKIGRALGFNMLDYNIAVLNDKVGCICKSMVDIDTEELEHGINLIKEAVPEFKVTERPVIYFKDVKKSFASYQGYIEYFIDILIFDAIIGNQDRHSENWAIIRSLDTSYLKLNTEKIKRMLFNTYDRLSMNKYKIPFKNFLKDFLKENLIWNLKFSPIYDSGSSLGREIRDEKIDDYLNDAQKIEKYIKNGRSEVRWDKKENHFELLKKVKTIYPDQINKTINVVLDKYSDNVIKDIILYIDNNLYEKYHESKLSLQRKELIFQFIRKRVELLKSVIS